MLRISKKQKIDALKGEIIRICKQHGFLPKIQKRGSFLAIIFTENVELQAKLQKLRPENCTIYSSKGLTEMEFGF